MISTKENGRLINHPANVVPALRSMLATEMEFDQQKEHFWAVGLNGANRIAYIDLVSLGLSNRTLVHPREVFRVAVLKSVAAIVIAHNHPSGEIEPSADDREVTKLICEAGRVLGIRVLDHVILEGAHCNRYFSFLEVNQMPPAPAAIV